MSAMPAIVISGGDPLIRKLNTLPDKLFVKGLVWASRRAMKPVVAQAKENAPVEHGLLKRSIGVKVKKYKRAGIVLTMVGPRSGFGMEVDGRKRDPVYYAHLQEGGHRIVRPNSLQTRWSKKVQNIIRVKGTGETVGHVAGRPFLRPALVNNESKVVSVLRSDLGAFIEQQAKR